jgi:hypothetical protein
MMEVLPPMASVFTTIGLAVLIAVAPGAAWAGPHLSGSYQAALWGRVELSLSQERLLACTWPREGCQAPELGPGGLLVLRPASGHPELQGPRRTAATHGTLSA